VQGRTRRQALAEGVTAGVFFGTAAIFIRFVQGLDSFSIVFWRLVIACAALIALLVVFGRVIQFKLVRENWKELLGLGLFLGLHFVFFTFSVRDTTILNATVLVSTAPIFSMLVSSFLFRVKPSRFALVGLMVSFIGVCVIAFGETMATKTAGQSVSPTLKGDLEGVAAAAVEAFYLNYGGRVRKEMGLLSAMLPIYAFSAIIVVVLSFPAGNPISPLPLVAETALPLVGLGLLPTAIAHTLYFSSLSNLKSFETASLALLEPVGATLLGIAAFQEVPAPVFAFGAVMVLAGTFFVIRNRRR
jgi:drug/metabolite transporter (DMT)-like permease